MRIALRRWLGLALASSALLATAPAFGQVRWDASLAGGVTQRWLAESRAGAEGPGVGPAGQVSGHAALLPLVRVGAYFSFDRSPMPGDIAARHVFAGGIRSKLMLPWAVGGLRPFGFLGLGFAGAYAPSYPATFVVKNDFTDAATPTRYRVEGGGGTFFELPVGLGASYKLMGPWALTAELGAKVGFGSGGALYDPQGLDARWPGEPSMRVARTGVDRWSLGLVFGILYDR